MSNIEVKEFATTYKCEFISTPKYAWECEFMPNATWRCEEGKQPNAFHRLMQRLMFGFKWSRIK